MPLQSIGAGSVPGLICTASVGGVADHRLALCVDHEAALGGQHRVARVLCRGGDVLVGVQDLKRPQARHQHTEEHRGDDPKRRRPQGQRQRLGLEFAPRRWRFQHLSPPFPGTSSAAAERSTHAASPVWITDGQDLVPPQVGDGDVDSQQPMQQRVSDLHAQRGRDHPRHQPQRAGAGAGAPSAPPDIGSSEVRRREPPARPPARTAATRCPAGRTPSRSAAGPPKNPVTAAVTDAAPQRQRDHHHQHQVGSGAERHQPRGGRELEQGEHEHQRHDLDRVPQGGPNTGVTEAAP